MRVGLLICAYDMARELPRTIYTFSRQYQQDIDDVDYEIVVLDNGSYTADESILRGISPNVRVVHVENGNPSPVAAINAIARSMDCSLIGIVIDGARMASPRLLAKAVAAHRLDANKVIGTIAFHIGPDVHMRAPLTGYDQHVEDRLLETTPWRSNGYALFDISTLAGSSSSGWFGRIAESNAVFMGKSVWDELGGFDERFVQPGGGFCNIEFWGRAVRASRHAPFSILGEATFHQIHGGAATSGSDETRIKMHEEYQQLTGSSFVMPEYTPCFVGELDLQRLSAGLPRRVIET